MKIYGGGKRMQGEYKLSKTKKKKKRSIKKEYFLKIILVIFLRAKYITLKRL
jgi:hypothetical protein